MSERIGLDELESYLWNSAVLLRTNIDAGAYKQYIFPLLFFKRICDVYDEETAAAIEKYGEDIDDFDEEELHTFVVPQGYHWKNVREVSENVGLAIVNAFHAIEKANIEQLHGVFGDGAWTNKNRLPDALLKDLIEHFSSKTLSIANCPEDELGQEGCLQRLILRRWYAIPSRRMDGLIYLQTACRGVIRMSWWSLWLRMPSSV